MRGQKKFLSLFPGETPATAGQEPERKGRSAAQIEKRNQLLFVRYVYYSRLAKAERRSYEWVIENLETEMFLSSATITDLVTNNVGQIHQLRGTHHEVDGLRKLYPWLTWRKAVMI